jgi:hypothetical protein
MFCVGSYSLFRFPRLRGEIRGMYQRTLKEAGSGPIARGHLFLLLCGNISACSFTNKSRIGTEPVASFASSNNGHFLNNFYLLIIWWWTLLTVLFDFERTWAYVRGFRTDKVMYLTTWEKLEVIRWAGSFFPDHNVFLGITTKIRLDPHQALFCPYQP